MPQTPQERAMMANLTHKNKVEKVENNKRMLFLNKKLDLEDLNKARNYNKISKVGISQFHADSSIPNYMKRRLDLEDIHDPNHEWFHNERYYLPITPEHIPHAHQEIDLKKITRPERKLYGWKTIPKLEHEDQSHAEQSNMEREDAGRGTIGKYGGKPMPRPSEDAQSWIIQDDPEFTSGNRPLEKTDWRKEPSGKIYLNATTNIAERGTNATRETLDKSNPTLLDIYSGNTGIKMPKSKGINPLTNPINKYGIIKRQYRKKL